MSILRQGFKDNSKEKKSSEPVINWRIDTWHPELGPKLQLLKKFHTELLIANKSTNLIGNTAANADLVHFADCIRASQIIHKATGGAEIHDVGSGSGFPGLVYAILFPDVVLHLVEYDTRKTDFLRNMISMLGLKNVDVLEKTFESIAPGSVQYAMTRGLAAIPKTLLNARKILALKGTYYHIKGTEWPLEIAEMPAQLCTFWNSGLVGEYSAPIGDQKYFVIGSQKIQN